MKGGWRGALDHKERREEGEGGYMDRRELLIIDGGSM